jgi:hypothetical protein
MYKTSLVCLCFETKIVNSFRFSFCNLKGFWLFHHQLLIYLLKNQKESKGRKERWVEIEKWKRWKVFVIVCRWLKNNKYKWIVWLNWIRISINLKDIIQSREKQMFEDEKEALYRSLLLHDSIISLNYILKTSTQTHTFSLSLLFCFIQFLFIICSNVIEIIGWWIVKRFL